MSSQKIGQIWCEKGYLFVNPVTLYKGSRVVINENRIYKPLFADQVTWKALWYFTNIYYTFLLPNCTFGNCLSMLLSINCSNLNAKNY